MIVCRSALIGVSCFVVKEQASMSIQPLPAEVKIALAGIIFAAGLTDVLAVSLHRRYIFRGWHSWPIAEATVETAEVRVYRGTYSVSIGYSYVVNGSYMTGWEEKMFSSREAEAEAYVANIRGQKVVIRFNPKDPERSRIDQAPVSVS
jgi:hypothetical protein